MDAAQILLFSVVGILTVLLVVLGIQVFFILKELRSTLSKANRVLTGAETITEAISRPVESLSTVMSTVKLGSLLASFLSKKKAKREE